MSHESKVPSQLSYGFSFSFSFFRSFESLPFSPLYIIFPFTSFHRFQHSLLYIFYFHFHLHLTNHFLSPQTLMKQDIMDQDCDTELRLGLNISSARDCDTELHLGLNTSSARASRTQDLECASQRAVQGSSLQLNLGCSAVLPASGTLPLKKTSPEIGIFHAILIT